MNQTLTDDHDHDHVIAARWIVPVVAEPIHRGWIRLLGQRIVEIGSGKSPQPAIDLGDVAVLPGLVNAHTHLEFSDCECPIGIPGVSLAKWIGQVIAARAATTPASKQAAIARGINESVVSGVRLIGEITTPPCQYDSHLIDLVCFGEVVGLSESRWRERLQATSDFIAHNATGAWSPHAPYSTAVEAIQICVKRASSTHQPLSMHIAESPAERELLCSGTGPLADTLREIGAWQDDLFPWDGAPINDLIETLSAAPRVLLVHGNDLRTDEINTIAQYPHFTVVYCPRTHAFFGYDRHPVAELLRAGVPVALGTDSRASNPDLNLWSEVQHLLRHRLDIPPSAVLKMAFVNGANALGREEMGRISIDASPGLGCVETTAASVDELVRDLAERPYQPLDPKLPAEH